MSKITKCGACGELHYKFVAHTCQPAWLVVPKDDLAILTVPSKTYSCKVHAANELDAAIAMAASNPANKNTCYVLCVISWETFRRDIVNVQDILKTAQQFSVDDKGKIK